MGRPKQDRTPEEMAKDYAKKRAIGHTIGEHVTDWMNNHFNEIALLEIIKKLNAKIDFLEHENNRYAYAFNEMTRKGETKKCQNDTQTDYSTADDN